jgi:hypothetical protein
MSETVDHAYGFDTGPDVPGAHLTGPVSVKKPSRDEQPGPARRQPSTPEEALIEDSTDRRSARS